MKAAKSFRGASSFRGLILGGFAILTACGTAKNHFTPLPVADASVSVIDGSFVCASAASEACVRDTHYTCTAAGEFFDTHAEDCAAAGKVCVDGLWCVVCHPGEAGCQNGNAAVCKPDGSGWMITAECNVLDGEACDNGVCVNLCDRAVSQRSYQGCEFWGADLDNAGIGPGQDASAQQYSIVVSNPWQIAAEVTIERNDAPQGQALQLVTQQHATVPPGDLQIFNLPRREVDGSSSNKACVVPSDCLGPEVCVLNTTGFCRLASGALSSQNCSDDSHCTEDGGVGGTCFKSGACRVSAMANGIDDGTHSALTSRAYRVKSTLPIVAYQFNPLDNVGVFSNDASLLLPSATIQQDYSVVGWPQTLAKTMDPNTNGDIDLRAFLTIIGTVPNTTVTVKLGTQVVDVLGAGLIPEGHPGDTINLTIGPFDVINLETGGFNADFTGSIVHSTSPVSVFVGSEASDAPRFDDLRTRQCCADHLEEQLLPDSNLGREFIIGRMPRRTTALNAAFVNPTNMVGEFNEPEWVRILATSAGTTDITTSLPSPNDSFSLDFGSDIILRADQDFLISASQSVSVVQLQSSQDAVGIPSRYPGGDPSIIVVPPMAQFRQDYVLLTPKFYGFDFITILAPYAATIQLDGASLTANNCTTSPADGIARMPTDPPPDKVIHRCQLSYPDVVVMGNISLVQDGVQGDGVHTVLSDLPIGVVMYGFDKYVSYAYPGGMNYTNIN